MACDQYTHTSPTIKRINSGVKFSSEIILKFWNNLTLHLHFVKEVWRHNEHSDCAKELQSYFSNHCQVKFLIFDEMCLKNIQKIFVILAICQVKRRKHIPSSSPLKTYFYNPYLQYYKHKVMKKTRYLEMPNTNTFKAMDKWKQITLRFSIFLPLSLPTCWFKWFFPQNMDITHTPGVMIVKI